MIQIISGAKGSGKTKQIIDLANEAIAKESGIVVFIDDDKRHEYDLKAQVRLVDAGDYKAFSGYSAETFLAFISGILAANYDVTLVCIDGLVKMTGVAPADLGDFFEQLNTVSSAHDCKFVVALNAEKEELPESAQKYCM